MSQIAVKVPEIHCQGCVDSIRKSLEVLDGFQELSADLGTKELCVRYDEGRTGPEAIQERIELAGFDVT